MKNRGFTLVELLGVIVLLIVIFLLVFPSVTNILSQSEETVYQKQINDILTAAYDFTLKNISYLPQSGEKSYVTLGELKYNGLIESNIKNPKTLENFEDNLVISINNVGANYEYSNENARLEGDYLYTVEIEQLNDLSITDLLPKITLDGLIQNSSGDYIMTLDLKQEFNNVSFSATSYTGEDLTSKIKKYILLDDKTVESIDSTKAGIYKIIYSVVDSNGYANQSILNVIIADKIAPEITFPNNNTINKDVQQFNLLNGVVCTDNSGFCDIETSGVIDYGVVGKYVIEYTSKDPSGNTTIKKRVITIE